MRTVSTTFLSMGLVALIAGPAAAQGPGRGFGARMGNFSGLLANESVQKELKLDDKQVLKAEELDEKMSEEAQEKFQGLQDLEGQERFAKMQQIGREINASALKQAGEFLKPEQVTRLKQIACQVRGPQAFSDPEVVSKLNLTDAQKSAVEGIQRDSMQEMRTIFEENREDREAMRKKMGELRKQILSKIEGELNDEQRKTWKELLGSPFEIKFEQN
jgi:Spy/CpxP family protein refolding chaperone